jgi:hypothetical protein
MAKPAIKPLCEKCGGIVWGANRLWVEVDGVEELRCKRCEGVPNDYQTKRKVKLQGARMNDSQLLMPAKPKVRVPYEPDPKDAAVKRCVSERNRVLKLRQKFGPEWYLHPDVRKAS